MPFDDTYELLADLYDDDSYPKRDVDRLVKALRRAVKSLENGKHDAAAVRAAFAPLAEETNAVSADLQSAGVELDTDVLAADVLYILEWYDLDVDVEDIMAQIG